MAINLNDKTNKSIAALASKIMQEQPTKMPDFKDTKPIESDMVQRVMNTGLKGNFIKEEVNDNKYKPEKKPTEQEKYDKPKKPRNPTMEEVEQLDEIGDTPKGKEVLRNYISTAARSVHNKAYRAGKKYGETEKYDVPNIAGSIKRQLSITQAANRLAKEEVEQVDESWGTHAKNYRHITNMIHGKGRFDKFEHSVNPGSAQSDYGSALHHVHAHYPEIHSAVKKHLDAAQKHHDKAEKSWGKDSFYDHHENAVDHANAAVGVVHSHIKKLSKGDSIKEEQINEARFGRAIDPSKLSPEAKARLAARDAAKKPVEAKPGTKLGDIAASFKKPEPKKEEPKEEPKPAAKTGNKFTQLRQQNMERMKQHQAAVASGKVGGGGDQRSGGKLGAPGDVEKKGTEIKGDRGAEHAARTGEKDAGSVVSGTTKAQSERNKRKKGAEDEQDDVHEALKGKQHKIDANRNGEIDAHDFKLLRAKHKKGQ